MERNEHTLVPQWLKSSGSVSSGGSSNNLLKSPYSDQINHSRFKRSFSSNGSGHSRSYNSSSRSRYNRDWEEDIDIFFDKGKLVLGEGKCHDHFDSLKNKLSNRIEKDSFQSSRSMSSGRWGEAWSNKITGDLNNARSDAMVAEGVVGSMHKTVFEEEFPLLGPEAKPGSSEIGRVLSSGSIPATHSLLTGPSAVIANNGLTSALHGIPVTIGTSSSATVSKTSSSATVSNRYNVSASFSSMASSITGLNMAGALSQGTPLSQTSPQSSTQKLEELAIKQSRLLIPMTPSVPRALVVSPSEKSKVKTGQQQQHLFFSSFPSSHSHQGGPAKSDGLKTTPGNSRIVSPSRELNSLSSAEKDSLSPSGSRIVLGPINGTTSASMSAPSRNSSNNANPALGGTLEKRATSQAKSRNEFFKSLSKKSSSINPCSDPCPSGMPCTSEISEVIRGNVTVSLTVQSGEAPSVETSTENSLTETSCIISDSGNACGEPSKIYSNEMQHLSSNSLLYPDEEEAAFLRSLGWEESAGDDEGLTEEEIRDFCEKYMKLQPSSNILHKVHQRMIALPLDSNTGSCGEASSGLS